MRRQSSSSSGTNTFGCAHVPVVLGYLVLEDQVVAEGVPGQLAAQAMILMQVGALVREDRVWRELGLQLLEEVLDLPRRRKGRSHRRKSRTMTWLLGHACKQRLGAALRLDARARARRSERPSETSDTRSLLDRASGSCPRSRSRCRPDGRRSQGAGAAPRRADPTGVGNISPTLREPRDVNAPDRASQSCHGAVPFSCRTLEPLLVLERVHRRPEALVALGQQLPGGEQSMERLLHEVLAGPQLVEDLRAQHEVAAVDPDV